MTQSLEVQEKEKSEMKQIGKNDDDASNYEREDRGRSF